MTPMASRRALRRARRDYFGGRRWFGFYSFRLVMEASFLRCRYLVGGKNWAILLVRPDEHAEALGKDRLREIKRREVENG